MKFCFETSQILVFICDCLIFNSYYTISPSFGSVIWHMLLFLSCFLFLHGTYFSLDFIYLHIHLVSVSFFQCWVNSMRPGTWSVDLCIPRAQNSEDGEWEKCDCFFPPLVSGQFEVLTGPLPRSSGFYFEEERRTESPSHGPLVLLRGKLSSPVAKSPDSREGAWWFMLINHALNH